MLNFGKFLGASALLVCLILSGVAWTPARFSNKGRRYLDLAAFAGQYQMKVVRSGKKVLAEGPGKKLVMEVSNRKIVWNGMTILLGHPVIQQGDRIGVSESDWNSTLRALFSLQTIFPHRLRVITLDAGHGGSDRGAAGRISKEKDITLKLTRRVADILRRCQYQVHLTRHSDVSLPLKSRTALQRSRQSDLFVSIHVNATTDKKVTGIETFCLTPADAPSSHGKGEFVKNPSNRFDINNFALACCVQRSLLKRTGALDRGVKRARFAVLRDISAPGVLVEIGFISNLQEERRLNDPVYVEKIARGIAEGIILYHCCLMQNYKR